MDIQTTFIFILLVERLEGITKNLKSPHTRASE